METLRESWAHSKSLDKKQFLRQLFARRWWPWWGLLAVGEFRVKGLQDLEHTGNGLGSRSSVARTPWSDVILALHSPSLLVLLFPLPTSHRRICCTLHLRGCLHLHVSLALFQKGWRGCASTLPTDSFETPHPRKLQHDRIAEAIRPFSDNIADTQGTWAVPVALLVIVSIPPLVGHEIIILVVGIIWGLWWGFLIAVVGTFAGEILCCE